MHVNPLGIDPILFQIPLPRFMPMNELQVRWYGVMYVLGFLWGGLILKRLSKEGFLRLSFDQIDRYVSHLILGMFFGARIFYVFIYNWDHYSHNLGKIFSVWEGGLSFHGAVVGMCLVTYLTARKNKLHFLELSDSMAVAGSLGLFFGRMGNFINGELYGRVTDSVFGLVFPNGGPMARHPSQLYEGLSEGVLLFIILWIVHNRQKFYGIVSVLFVGCYGLFRYIVEFFRQPDAQLGYYFGGTTTMGQILCFFMIVGSIFLYLYVRKAKIRGEYFKL